MRKTSLRLLSIISAAGLVTTLLVTGLQADDAGVVRISDQAPAAYSGPSGPVQPVMYTSNCDDGSCYVHEGPSICLTGNRFLDWMRINKIKMRSSRASFYRKLKDLGNCGWDDENCVYENKQHKRLYCLSRKMRCKFGYLYPTGCCGEGCPLIGTYNIVYAADPHYFDARDGELYSAQGYGVPMAVPLAPTVRHTYNYGWGVPSSRLTPVSRVAPQIQYINPQ